MAMYIATPGFLRLALRPSSVTSTADTSIWLVISAATLGGPPISLDDLGLDVELLEESAVERDEERQDELIGNMPTLTLSCALAGDAAKPASSAAAAKPRIVVRTSRFILPPPIDPERPRISDAAAFLPILDAIPMPDTLERASFADIDDRDHRAAALRSLMHGVDRHEHRRIADRRRGDAANGRLGMAVMMHVGIVEHDLAAAAQRAAPVGLALHEDS